MSLTKFPGLIRGLSMERFRHQEPGSTDSYRQSESLLRLKKEKREHTKYSSEKEMCTRECSTFFCLNPQSRNKTLRHLQCSHFESHIVARHSQPATRRLTAAVPVRQQTLSIRKCLFQVHKRPHCKHNTPYSLKSPRNKLLILTCKHRSTQKDLY